MKPHTYKQRILFYLLLYVVGIAFELIFFFASPYYKQKQNFLNMASNAAEHYAEDGTIGINGKWGLSCLIYDADGILASSDIAEPFEHIYFNLDKYMKKAQAGKSDVYYGFFMPSSFENTNQHRTFGQITCYPVYAENGELYQVVFIFRDLPDIYNSFIISFVILTLLIVQVLFAIWYSAKKDRAMEKIQQTYIANMNHNLKSPISAIRALTETLADGKVTDPEKQLYYYGSILKEAGYLENTVKELLELSKLQTPGDFYEKKKVRPEEIFSAIILRYQTICEDLDIQFSYDQQQLVSLPEVLTNAKLASRVMDLYLHNATKFTPPETGRISVSFLIQQNKIILCVSDNGTGISDDALPHVFDRFFKSDSPINEAGSGLGLSIAKEIARGLKESVWVSSKEHEGTSFFFSMHMN